MEVSTKKNVVLVSWRFQFKFGVTGSVFKNFAFIVEGSRADDGREWASSEVMDVEPPFRIHTQNTIYDLRGPIDKEKCVGRGFDVHFINKFRKGFPQNWKEELRIYVDQLFRAVSKKFDQSKLNFAPNQADQVEEALPEDDQAEVEENDDDANSDQHNVHISETSQDSDAGQYDENEVNDSEFTEDLNDTQVSDDSDDETLRASTTRRSSPSTITPIRSRKSRSPLRKNAAKSKRTSQLSQNSQFSQSAQPEELKRSKSGRVIKPRLSVGENIVYDTNGEVLEIRGNTTRTHMSKSLSANLRALSHTYGLDTQSPQQKERKLLNVTQRPTNRRRSTVPKKKALVDYDSAEDYKSLDEVSLDEEVEATPLPIRHHARRRIDSDPEEEEEEEETPVKQRAGRRKRQPQKRSDEKKKPTPKGRKRKTAENASPATTVDGEETDNPANTTAETIVSKSGEPRKKKIKAVWNLENKEKLKGLIHLFHPANDHQWSLVSSNFDHVFEVDQLKEQAVKMKLIKRRPEEPEVRTIQDDLQDVLQKCNQLGNCPRAERDTLRYAQKKAETEKKFRELRNRIEDEQQKENKSQDSLDGTFSEIAKGYAPARVAIPTKVATPNRRHYIPQPVPIFDDSQDSLTNSMNNTTVEDSFSVPDWSNQCKVRFRMRH